VADPNRRDLEVALALENATERKLAVVSLIDQLVQRLDWRARRRGARRKAPRRARAGGRAQSAFRELLALNERINLGETVESWELHEIADRVRRER